MSSPVNLYYIRAAIEAATGIRLTLSKTRQYLKEEGLLTPAQDDEMQEFRGYDEYYWNDGGSHDVTLGNDPDIKDDIDRALRSMEIRL
jgi:hypothetical protein